MSASLGFGCSRLVGGKTPSESLRLLEIAFDAGIRHFDVARLYGTGDAERIVGTFVKRHRDDVTVTTKFGIAPMAATTSTKALKTALRSITRRSAVVRQFARRHSERTLNRGLFTPEDASRSLHASLEALGTDRVDDFLLHDGTLADWQTEGLVPWLEETRATGLIGAYGISTAWADALAIIGAAGPRPPVAQFDASALRPTEEQLLDLPTGIDIRTFAPLSVLLPLFRSADPDSLRSWGREIHADLADETQVASLAMLATMALPRVRVVVFSSDSETKIRSNAALADTSEYPSEQIAAFTRLARRVASDRRGASAA